MAIKQPKAVQEPKRDEEKPISVQRMWLREHKRVLYVLGALLLIAAIFFGIRYYQNITHPLTRFMKASSKNFNSSFSFALEARRNEEPVMRYTGSYAADPEHQNLRAVYDADYVSYTYKGVVYAENETRLSGSLYDGEWRVRDCTDKLLNFFDFNTDYRKGGFDGASFLRFTDLTTRYSAKELDAFMKLFKIRMDGNSPLAKLSITDQNGAKTYSFAISTEEFFNLVRDKGASIFFSAIDYDAFCALYGANEKTVRNSDCTLSYTINSSGWMSELELSLTVDGDRYAVRCTMDDFGSAEPEIPADFFKAIPEE